MRLTGEQRSLLQKALGEAFPNLADLEIMLKKRLEINLSNIVVPRESSLDYIIFRVIEYYDAHSSIHYLIMASFAEQPSKELMCGFAVDWAIRSEQLPELLRAAFGVGSYEIGQDLAARINALDTTVRDTNTTISNLQTELEARTTERDAATIIATQLLILLVESMASFGAATTTVKALEGQLNEITKRHVAETCRTDELKKKLDKRNEDYTALYDLYSRRRETLRDTAKSVNDTRDSLSAESAAHQTTLDALKAEQEAHWNTIVSAGNARSGEQAEHLLAIGRANYDLRAEQAAHQATRNDLDKERQTHEWAATFGKSIPTGFLVITLLQAALTGFVFPWINPQWEGWGFMIAWLALSSLFCLLFNKRWGKIAYDIILYISKELYKHSRDFIGDLRRSR